MNLNTYYIKSRPYLEIIRYNLWSKIKKTHYYY